MVRGNDAQCGRTLRGVDLRELESVVDQALSSLVRLELLAALVVGEHLGAE
jgi:hypothetical protein